MRGLSARVLRHWLVRAVTCCRSTACWRREPIPTALQAEGHASQPPMTGLSNLKTPKQPGARPCPAGFHGVYLLEEGKCPDQFEDNPAMGMTQLAAPSNGGEYEFEPKKHGVKAGSMVMRRPFYAPNALHSAGRGCIWGNPAGGRAASASQRLSAVNCPTSHPFAHLPCCLPGVAGLPGGRPLQGGHAGQGRR